MAQTAQHHDKTHEVVHHAAEHAEHAEHGMPHLLNIVGWIAKIFPATADFMHQWESVIFSIFVIAIISTFCILTMKKKALIPTKPQLIVETLVLLFDNIAKDVMGPIGRKYAPFVGSLFIYILVTNYFGLFPLSNSATGFLTTTAALSIVVFFYVQYTGITKLGIGGYFYHLIGTPKSVPEWCLVPLFFVLHVLGEFIKPVSLMFRLYGNIMAGHILLAVLLSLGVDCIRGIFDFLHFPQWLGIGIPFHLPFLFLELIVGFVQAFVFALLSTIYLVLMLPHDHGDHEEAHA